jgi:hypothetical protein
MGEDAMYSRLLLILTCSVLIAGCRSQPPAALASDAVPAPTPEYVTLEMTTLNVGSGAKVRATVEELREPVKGLPYTKLVMKNLSTGKIIYEDETGTCSLHNPDTWINRGTALVETCGGGSGGSVIVYEVSDTDARVALDDAYRAGAIVVPATVEGGDMSLLVLDSESGAGRLQAKRYQYDDGKKEYVLTGTTHVAQLMKSIESAFKKSQK